MKCPYIKPTITQCLNCSNKDCVRDERQDDREKCKKHYFKDINTSRKYHREYEREHYSTVKNTEKCRKHRLKHPNQKVIYDRLRYERKKAEGVS